MNNQKLVAYIESLDTRFAPFSHELANLIYELAGSDKELEDLQVEYPDYCGNDYFYEYLNDHISGFTWKRLHSEVVSYETWYDDDDLIDANYYMTDLAKFLHDNRGNYDKVKGTYLPLLEEYDTRYKRLDKDDEALLACLVEDQIGDLIDQLANVPEIEEESEPIAEAKQILAQFKRMYKVLMGRDYDKEEN